MAKWADKLFDKMLKGEKRINIIVVTSCSSLRKRKTRKNYVAGDLVT